MHHALGMLPGSFLSQRDMFLKIPLIANLLQTSDLSHLIKDLRVMIVSSMPVIIQLSDCWPGFMFIIVNVCLDRETIVNRRRHAIGQSKDYTSPL
jgi:hypothetical protein